MTKIRILPEFAGSVRESRAHQEHHENLKNMAFTDLITGERASPQGDLFCSKV